jgi:hypothetical protein
MSGTTVSACAEELRRGYRGGGASNAALPLVRLLCKEGKEVEELKAKLRMRFGWRGCGGERVRARRSGGL